MRSPRSRQNTGPCRPMTYRLKSLGVGRIYPAPVFEYAELTEAGGCIIPIIHEVRESIAVDVRQTIGRHDTGRGYVIVWQRPASPNRIGLKRRSRAEQNVNLTVVALIKDICAAIPIHVQPTRTSSGWNGSRPPWPRKNE